MLLSNLREKVRVKMEQNAEVSLGIIVRWVDNCFLNGIDGNKKEKGVKRHVVVAKNCFLLTVMVTIACHNY